VAWSSEVGAAPAPVLADEEGDTLTVTLTLNDPAAVGMSMNGTIEDGMAAMSAKFKEMGSNVYLDAEKVKESNRVL